MSRRKQTKPQHLPSDEDQSATPSSSVKRETPPRHSCVSNKSPPPLHVKTEKQRNSSGFLSDSQILNSCQGRQRRDRKVKRSNFTEKGVIHQSDRTCKYCGVHRNSPADLLRHLRKHTGEQPFSCSLCTRAFKAKRSLQYHQYMNHGIEFNGGRGCVRLNTAHKQKLDVVNRRESDRRAGLGQCSPLSSTGSLEDSSQSAPEMKESSSWLCGAMPSDTLDPCSYSLGREPQDQGIQSNGEDHLASAPCLVSHPSLSYKPCVEPPSPDDSQSSILTPQESPEAYNEDPEDDKFSSQLSRRTCQFCSKVCPKPSDLKRHLMVHTGERPFKCDMCGKGFKAKGSMQYHQKAAHGLDIELSQGLEERYLRLKHRTCTLQAQKEPVNLSTDKNPSSGIIVFPGSGLSLGSNGPMGESMESDFPIRTSTPVGSVIHDLPILSRLSSGFPSSTNLEGEAFSNKGQLDNLNGRNNNVPTDLSSPQDLSSKKCSSPHLKSSEGKLCNKENGDILLEEDDSLIETRPDAKTDYVETEENLLDETDDGNEVLKKEAPFIKNRISIKNETILVTRLDGFNLISGMKTSLYKCHMCGKMFNYLSRLQCHLSVHFERHMTTYQCSMCGANFKFKTQLLRHSRFHTRTPKSEDINLLPKPESQGSDPVSSNSLSDNELDEGDVKDDEVEIAIEHSSLKPKKYESSHVLAYHSNKRLPRRYHRLNGMYSCLFCKKTFFRLFSLQRHERMHTGVKPCYCKECGKGFSEPRNLRQHILRFHNEGFQMDFVRKARRRAIIASLRSSARASRSADSSEKDDQKCSRMDSCCRGHDIDEGEHKSSSTPSALSPSAKDLSTREEFDDDVMVVLPAEAPCEPLCDSRSHSWSGDEGDINTEIMAAPKRHLLSFRKDGFSCKSRRKSSVPVKIENMSPPHQSDCSRKLDLNDDMPTDLCKTTVKEEPMSIALPVSSNAASSALSSVLFSNSLGLGHGTGPSHPLFLSSHLLPNSGLSVNPVMSIPITVQVPVDPHSAASSSPSSASMGLMAQVSPNDFLVGYPRVKWEGNPLAGIPNSEPIPRRRSLALENSYNLHSALMADKNGISSDGRKVTSLSRTHSRLHMHLPYATSTSSSTACSSTLTGFYSRLHVVNSPVNRDKVCKPLLLPDGRSIYRCVFCNKDFPTYSDINRHMDFHEDIRPYKCKFCDYYARTNSQLKVHMMRHQGIREFCCKLCNYKGVTQSDLNRHMKSQIHMLKSRNECPHCMEGFVTPKNLERHIMEICQARKRSEKPA